MHNGYSAEFDENIQTPVWIMKHITNIRFRCKKIIKTSIIIPWQTYKDW